MGVEYLPRPRGAVGQQIGHVMRRRVSIASQGLGFLPIVFFAAVACVEIDMEEDDKRADDDTVSSTDPAVPGTDPGDTDGIDDGTDPGPVIQAVPLDLRNQGLLHESECSARLMSSSCRSWFEPWSTDRNATTE